MVGAAALALLTAPAAADFASPVRIGTWNIKQNKRQNQQRHGWPERRAKVLETFAAADADLIGIQEQFLPGGCPQGNRGDPLMGYALRDILEAFPDYAVVQKSCAALGGGEPILYRMSRFTLLAQGATKGCGDFHTPRQLNWAKFREVASGQEILLYNLHLHARSTRQKLAQARVLGCDLAMQMAAPEHAQVPVAVVGDMNDPHMGPVMSFLTHEGTGLDGDGLFSEYPLVEVLGPAATHRGGEHLDHIYLDPRLVGKGGRVPASSIVVPVHGRRENCHSPSVDPEGAPEVAASDHCFAWTIAHKMTAPRPLEAVPRLQRRSLDPQ